MDPPKSIGISSRVSSSTLGGSASPSFTNRRGNKTFSSAKFATTSRPRKGSLLSFRSTRRNAARPTRTKAILDSLLQGLSEGIVAIKEIADDMRSQIPSEGTGLSSRQHHYMELEKQVKALERKIRAVEVHKDRIEELRDEYLLKLKLKDGAFNLAQALSNRPSKSAKEKLVDARFEQKELSEDLCDIEDELETKLGVFKVHINEFTSLHHSIASGEVIECQLKLATQKWKARCKIARHQQQFWQDNDIFLLGKVSDELFLKIIEVKRIQGNNHVGTMKCQTREFFSFFPQNVSFTLPTSDSIKLQMDVRWSPLLGDDFLSELDLRTIYCYVGAQPTKVPIRPSLSNVSRHHAKSTSRSSDKKKEERRYSKNEEKRLRSSSIGNHQQNDVKLEKFRPLSSPNMDRVIRPSTPDLLAGQDNSKYKMFEGSLSQSSDHSPSPVRQHQRSSSAGSRTTTTVSSASFSQDIMDHVSVGSGGSDAGYHAPRTPQNISLSSLLESVLSGLDEPREQYQELKLLEMQLLRLENALRGGHLTKAPSMTLSESNALDSFGFLESVDDCRRFSHLSQISEGERTGSFSDFICLKPDQVIHETESEGIGTASSTQDDVTFNDIHEPLVVKESTGCPSIDRVLLQHLLHCEYLLQHLQAQGPLNVKLSIGLKKLFQEAEVVREVLNMAADPDNMPKVEQLLPELAAHDHLFRFWKAVSGRDDPLCVSCELFVVALDEKYGQTLWNDFPEIANKVFSELLNRVLGLEGDECDPVESKMTVTVFQFAAHFLSIGSTKAIPKSLKQVAQEMKITEGLRDGDMDSRQKIATLLLTYPFNHGALIAAAHLISDKDTSLHDAAVAYLNNFAGNSPWRAKAVQYFIEGLEHPDQAVRIGSCAALGQLKATTAVSQLKYLAKADFTQVKLAAVQALQELGNDFDCCLKREKVPNTSAITSINEHKLNSIEVPVGNKVPVKQGIHRTRSAESGLVLESNEKRTKV